MEKMQETLRYLSLAIREASTSGVAHVTFFDQIPRSPSQQLLHLSTQLILLILVPPESSSPLVFSFNPQSSLHIACLSIFSPHNPSVLDHHL